MGKNSVIRNVCFLSCVTFLICAHHSKVFAAPAWGGLFELKQPSGKTFEARQRGDEWYHWVETKDGYGIYQNPKTGNWEYYVPSDEPDKKEIKSRIGRRQETQKRSIVGEIDPATLGIPKGLLPPRTVKSRPQKFDTEQITPYPTPSPQEERGSSLPQEEGEKLGEADATESSFDNGYSMGFYAKRRLTSTAASGTRHLVVIGVDYDDCPATYSAWDIQPLIFGSSNSVADYYNDVSYSAVTVKPATESQGTSNDGFIGWLRLSGNHPNPGQYTEEKDADVKASAEYKIARDAILAADQYIDYSSYDTDGSGTIEPKELSVITIVAGYDAAYIPDSPSVWAHCRYSLNVSVDGKTINDYAEFGEKHAKNTLRNIPEHLATFGIIAHEMGHLRFSLPDLYDTNKSSEGVGFFCLMGSGSWGADYGKYDGSSPTHLSAWSKECLEWGTVNTISSWQTYSAPKADGNKSSIFRINTSDSNQYFLLENRQFSGYDTGFKIKTGASGHGGLVIYHIDKLKTEGTVNDNNQVNDDVNDKGVDVEEANEGSLGYSMLDTMESRADTNMFFFKGNTTSFTGTTTPSSKLKNGNSTDVSITDVSAYGDTMTFTIPAKKITPKTIAAGDFHTVALKSDGTVWAWGYNSYGQLGIGTSGNEDGDDFRTTPVQVIGKDGEGFLSEVAAIEAGSEYTAALKSDGTVWTWGHYSQGSYYGDKTIASPRQVSSLSGITAIDCGYENLVALKSDGTVWDRWNSVYGLSAPYKEYSLVQVFSGATAIAAGNYHTVALKSDGTVWTWENMYDSPYWEYAVKHLGTATPMEVSGLSGVTAIAAGTWGLGQEHSVALKSDGTVWTWGDNQYGKLGDGTTTNRETPVQAKGLSGVIAIAAGSHHTVALKSDGTVWAWGNNSYGQLGDGTTRKRTKPVRVRGLSGVTAIAAEDYRTVARKSDGTVWAWGVNSYGELGDGTTRDRAKPVRVRGLNLQGSTP